MEKVTLRHIYIEIGRACNLKCEHCCKGEAENVQMSYKVMDALLDNVHFIDEITVTGGEPMLYVERMRTLLNKCKSRNIKVNYFNVITNCTMQSDEFVDLFNDWIEYCTFGNENELTISRDKYHKEYIEKYLKNVNVDENVEWYKSKLKECEFLPSTEETIDNDILIFNEGRVRTWTKERKEKYIQIKECKRHRTRADKLPIKEICEGEENICKYGCVYNCIRDTVYLNPYGDLFCDTFVSFELQEQCNQICVGNICDSSIYDIVSKWNENAENIEYDSPQTTLKDERFGELIERIKATVFIAERFSISGLFDLAKRELEKITLYIKVIDEGRNTYIDQLNELIEILEEDDLKGYKELKENDEKEYKKFLSYCNIANTTLESLKSIGEQMEEMYRNLENRKLKGKPGSLFVDPNLDFMSSFINIFR